MSSAAQRSEGRTVARFVGGWSGSLRNGGWTPNRRSGAAARLGGCFGGCNDRVDRPGERLVAEPGCGKQLLGTLLGTGEDGARLGAGPLERLLDLGAGGVRQLGCLVACLLEQTCAACLGLAQLL